MKALIRPLRRSFFARPVLDVARDLLGCLLVHHTPEGRCVGEIVETEAYGQQDPGSHAFRGKTARTAPMFEAPGHAYVYFTYGMHWCLNVVTDTVGVPGAVLLRAARPLQGIELMRERRGGVPDRDLARGPARLTQAFGVDLRHNRADLTVPPLFVCRGEPVVDAAVASGERIGLGASQDGRPWRFAIRSSSYVSRPTGGAKGQD